MKNKDREINKYLLIEKYSSWIKSYLKKLLVITIIYLILILGNYILIQNVNIYKGMTILYLFYFVYVATLGIFVVIKIKSIVKSDKNK